MQTELFENIRYGNHERNLVDIAFPKNAKGNVDLVLMIHGGGWIGGDKDLYKNEIRKFAESGVVSASISYRFICDEVNGLDILDDITAALKTIKEKGIERGVNMEKALLTGLSAGGHLSLLYAYARRDSAPITPAAVVALSGPADMADEEAAKQFLYGNEMGDSSFVAQLVSWLCGVRADENSLNDESVKEAIRKVSPVYYVDENTVPTVICHAENDKIVPFINAVLLEKALAENSVAHDFVIYPTSGHCLESDPDCTRRTDELTAEYIGKYLSVFEK